MVYHFYCNPRVGEDRITGSGRRCVAGDGRGDHNASVEKDRIVDGGERTVMQVVAEL